MMKASLTDEEMIRSYLPSQPEQCFSTLYTRYVDKVYRRCLSMTNDSEKAQDFTQDIFLKVFGKLNAFQERSSFSTWLYSIAFNYCADQLRLAKRLNFTSLEYETEETIADTHDALLHEETVQLVQQAKAMLTPQERTLLTLKYEDEMTIEEIAEIYDIKPCAVKMRLKRSRDKIHQFCAQQNAA